MSCVLTSQIIIRETCICQLRPKQPPTLSTSTTFLSLTLNCSLRNVVLFVCVDVRQIDCHIIVLFLPESPFGFVVLRPGRLASVLKFDDGIANAAGNAQNTSLHHFA